MAGCESRNIFTIACISLVYLFSFRKTSLLLSAHLGMLIWKTMVSRCSAQTGEEMKQLLSLKILSIIKSAHF